MLKDEAAKIAALEEQVRTLTDTVNELVTKLNNFTNHSHKFVTETAGIFGLSSQSIAHTGPSISLNNKSWTELLAELLNSTSENKEDLVAAWVKVSNKSAVLDNIVLLDGPQEQLTVTFINNIYDTALWKNHMTESFQAALNRALKRQGFISETKETTHD